MNAKEEKKKIGEYTKRDAYIFWRNFEGRETKFNDKGKRNFALAIPIEDVQKLSEDGWNVKCREPKREGDEPLYYIQVKVQMDSLYPPNIWLVSEVSNRKTKLDARTAKLVDTASIKSVDVTIRPYVYPPSSICPNGGVSAYLKTMYVTINEDVLDEKYANIPDTAFMGNASDEEELPFND